MISKRTTTKGYGVHGEVVHLLMNDAAQWNWWRSLMDVFASLNL